MKSKSTKTTASNLETRFDAGEDVSDYFDFSRRLSGAGRGAVRDARNPARCASK